ncbi:MAG: glycosyltransferase family 4 protein, partial [Candidatus Aenigmatarchaeota archaeon]
MGDDLRILIVWSRRINNTLPASSRPYYFMKYYDEKFSISVLAPNFPPHETEERAWNARFIKVYYTDNPIKKLLFSFITKFSFNNLMYAKNFNIFKIYYPNFQKVVNETLRENKFDLIYTDYIAHFYLNSFKKLNPKVPVFLEFLSPILFAQKQFIKYCSLKDKIQSIARYIFERYLEAKKYEKFDAGIYVTKTHFELSKPFVPKKAFIIPPGVDLNYFKPSESQEDEKLVFTGAMSYPVNVISVLNFYKKIYPMIKKEIPKVKFYIVGRSPSNEILRLAKLDSSITVTGAVEDVRPYVWSSAVFVVPIVVDDGGIKNKTLEAMAMGKAIVSTSLGAQDIGCENGKHLIIAENEKEFAERVVELIRTRERRRLGKNARKFVEENYSWDKKS